MSEFLLGKEKKLPNKTLHFILHFTFVGWDEWNHTIAQYQFCFISLFLLSFQRLRRRKINNFSFLWHFDDAARNSHMSVFCFFHISHFSNFFHISTRISLDADMSKVSIGRMRRNRSSNKFCNVVLSAVSRFVFYFSIKYKNTWSLSSRCRRFLRWSTSTLWRGEKR